MTIGKKDFWQFVKFNVIGLSNTLVDFLIFTLLTQAFSLLAYIAQVISYTCGIINSYVLNTRFTFRETSKHSAAQAAGFIAVNLVSLGVSLGMLALCKDVWGIQSDMWAKVIATPVALAVNFLGNRLLVFRSGKGAQK